MPDSNPTTNASTNTKHYATTLPAVVAALAAHLLQYQLESEHAKCWATADWIPCTRQALTSAAPLPAYALVVGGFGSIAISSYTDSMLTGVVWLLITGGLVVALAPTVAAKAAIVVVTAAAAVTLFSVHSSRF